jgi:prepilin-type N-terminal cleavage/methylation domain-containing protein
VSTTDYGPGASDLRCRICVGGKQSFSHGFAKLLDQSTPVPAAAASAAFSDSSSLPAFSFSNLYFLLILFCVLSPRTRAPFRHPVFAFRFQKSCSSFSNFYFRLSNLSAKARHAFTLLELLVVIAIIAILMVLVAPAFTNIKGGNDITTAAYTIKGVLGQGRTYAQANNTYAWIGFYEEDGSRSSTSPATAGTGRLVMSIVASKDGTNVYGSSTGTIDCTKLTQVGNLVKIDNVHLPLLAIGSDTGDMFDTRPALQFDPTAGYNYSRFGELNGTTPNTAPYTTPYNFQYPVGSPCPTAQYTFNKLLQFSPRGECRVNGDSYQVRRVVEVGLVQTRGSTVPTPVAGAGTSTATYSGNVVALQINGFGSTVKIYRR